MYVAIDTTSQTRGIELLYLRMQNIEGLLLAHSTLFIIWFYFVRKLGKYQSFFE